MTEFGFQSTVVVSARPPTTKLGEGVLIEGGELPSATNGGSWVQIFGTKYGPGTTKTTVLTPFGPPMSTDGELIDVTIDPRRTAPQIPGRISIVMNDILRFRIGTGNVSIVYPVLINWITGRVEPAWRCFRATARGQIERCAYPVMVDPRRRNELTFVRLFPEPDEGFTPEHVVIQPASKIEYLEAETAVSWRVDARIFFVVPDPAQVWLRIRVDEQEGWIHSEEDLAAIGLPLAG